MSATTYVPAPVSARLRVASRQRGIVGVAMSLAGFAAGYVSGLAPSIVGSSRGFEFDGQAYPYLYKRAGWTWLNERAVEVPVAVGAVAQAPPHARLLEVGNVLSHHGHSGHPVVDKYESGPGVLNIDALEVETRERYDLIVSISTLEHIGWDEVPREPARAERAVEHLAGLLAPGGVLLVTIPVGYNSVLDAAVRSGAVPFGELGALRRTNVTTWEQVEPEDAWDAPYDRLLCSANAVLIGKVRR